MRRFTACFLKMSPIHLLSYTSDESLAPFASSSLKLIYQYSWISLVNQLYYLSFQWNPMNRTKKRLNCPNLRPRMQLAEREHEYIQAVLAPIKSVLGPRVSSFDFSYHHKRATGLKKPCRGYFKNLEEAELVPIKRGYDLMSDWFFQTVRPHSGRGFTLLSICWIWAEPRDENRD